MLLKQRDSMKVLLIDDSEIIRNLLSDYLTDSGFQVDISVDGQDGIDKALANNYDLIICDTHMPKKNGNQVFEEVTKHKPDVKFIMTNSLPDKLVQQTCRGDTFCVLNKPFDLDEVKDTINKIFEKPQVK